MNIKTRRKVYSVGTDAIVLKLDEWYFRLSLSNLAAIPKLDED